MKTSPFFAYRVSGLIPSLARSMRMRHSGPSHRQPSCGASGGPRRQGFWRRLAAMLGDLPRSASGGAARMHLRNCHNIHDFRRLAKRRLPGPIFNYIDGAADDEVTYRRNTAAFETCDLVPNILRG